jgi:hypothetical protein
MTRTHASGAWQLGPSERWQLRGLQHWVLCFSCGGLVQGGLMTGTIWVVAHGCSGS